MRIKRRLRFGNPAGLDPAVSVDELHIIRQPDLAQGIKTCVSRPCGGEGTASVNLDDHRSDLARKADAVVGRA